MKTLLLIDANSLIHRCFHALPPLTAPDGRPTQSLYGISNILLRIFKDEKPEYASALFDRPERTFRKEKYEAYKAQRPKAPDDLVSQIIEARNLFAKFGIKIFEKAGFEADDLIATLAMKFINEKDLKVVILTGDLDTLQLVTNKKLVVRTFRKGISDTFIYDEGAVFDRYGLKPEQLTDYKALVGDQSDNVKGVAGVGPKTAMELLQKYGTLENVYAHLKDNPKAAKKLEGTEKEAEFSKSLVVLKKDVPVDLKEIGELEVNFDQEGAKEYFKNLGFESLVKRVNGEQSDVRRKTLDGEKKISNIQHPTSNSLHFSGQGSIFGNLPMAPMEFKGEEVLVYESEGGGFDSKDYQSLRLKVGFGLKNSIKKLWQKKEDLLPPYYDLGVAFWLLDPEFKNYDPASVFKKFFKKDFNGKGEDFKLALDFAKRKITEYEMEDVFYKIEMPLLRVLAEMENYGVMVDVSKLKILEDKIEKKLELNSKEIYKAAGEEFNINSPQQLSKILFDKLGLNQKLTKKTAGGAVSTREESLSALKGEHKIIDLILEYREDFKILSTYAKPLQGLLGSDGRIHTEFIQTGTATGRLSSQSPNLQNIPQESIWAKDLRTAFEAPKGFSFLAFDYSQLELRIFAAVAGDPKMTEAFKKGQDIHSLTASKILGIPLDRVTRDDRRLAKTLNFGLVYGMGVSAFSKSSGLKRTQAQDFINTYFREFSKIREWQEETKQEARRLGYVKTLTGRRRYLLGINSLAPYVVAEAERSAINQPLQGLGADIIKMAMIEVDKKIKEKGWESGKLKMILSIHDELLFEVRDDMIQEASEAVKEIMEGVFKLGVPLKVDISSGKDWGNLTKLKNK
ncbi:MAG: DNA polymerase [Patescibacteria group bacterium]